MSQNKSSRLNRIYLKVQHILNFTNLKFLIHNFHNFKLLKKKKKYCFVCYCLKSLKSTNIMVPLCFCTTFAVDKLVCKCWCTDAKHMSQFEHERAFQLCAKDDEKKTFTFPTFTPWYCMSLCPHSSLHSEMYTNKLFWVKYP